MPHAQQGPQPQKSRWGSAKSVTNICVTILWLGLLIVPGAFFNLYIFAGVDFDNDTLASVWFFAGLASLYGGVFFWGILAQVLIIKKDISWAALMPLCLITPLTQFAWFAAYAWAGEEFGYVCC